MALKQGRCLFASSLECASEQRAVGLSTVPGCIRCDLSSFCRQVPSGLHCAD